MSSFQQRKCSHQGRSFGRFLVIGASLCLVSLVCIHQPAGQDGAWWCCGRNRRSEPKFHDTDDNFTLLRLDKLDCMRVMNDSPGPLYNETTFLQLQDVYRRVVPRSKQTIAKHPSTGFLVPIEIRYAEGNKGRGVFATRDIAEGTVVWFFAQHAVFQDETTFVRFLSRLADERLVCDILLWSYVEVLEGERCAVVELDKGSFLNDGGDSSNLVEPIDGIQIAGRDIKAGEELTFQYSEILYDHDLKWYRNLKHRSNIPEDPY